MVALNDTTDIAGVSEDRAASGATELGLWGYLLSESRPLVLFLAFLSSFIVAAFVAVFVGHIVFKTPLYLWASGGSYDNKYTSVALSGDAGGAGNLGLPFEPLVVKKPGDYLKVDLGQLGDPTPGEDLAIFVWFKLRRSLAVGESASVLGKFDAQIRERPGYALALEGAPDGIRPKVYLSNGGPSGRWYSFSTHQINRRDWYLIELRISQDTFVSVSLARGILEQGIGEGRFTMSEPPVFLGGHRIADGGLPSTRVGMVLGAYGASRFRGELGPFGVVSGIGIAETINSYTIRQIIESPGAPPEDVGISPQFVRVWGTPLRDLGPRGVVIKRGEERHEGESDSALKSRSVKKKIGEGNKGSPAAKITRKIITRKIN